MSDQLQALLHTGVLIPAFPEDSRYHQTAVALLTTSNGMEIAYLKRRFVPPPENLADLQEHKVTEGERLDHIAATYLGNPELFWQICDANGVLKPNDVLEPIGRSIRITLPEGIPGAQDV